MVESSSTMSKEKTAPLEDSSYNIIHQLQKKADFLYSQVVQYIRDSEKDGKPDLTKLGKTIREDEQNHLKMLRDELANEVRQDRFS
jgi:hypothetical protein